MALHALCSACMAKASPIALWKWKAQSIPSTATSPIPCLFQTITENLTNLKSLLKAQVVTHLYGQQVPPGEVSASWEVLTWSLTRRGHHEQSVGDSGGQARVHTSSNNTAGKRSKQVKRKASNSRVTFERCAATIHDKLDKDTRENVSLAWMFQTNLSFRVASSFLFIWNVCALLFMFKVPLLRFVWGIQWIVASLSQSGSPL